MNKITIANEIICWYAVGKLLDNCGANLLPANQLTLIYSILTVSIVNFCE